MKLKSLIMLLHSRKLMLALFTVLILHGKLTAQQIEVHGGFLSDSIKIGEQTAFFLSARYPADQNVIFPDSSFRFSPFEFSYKRYFPTETKNGISKDSTVYFLATFEVDSIQKLSLPVYVLLKGDCTAVYSEEGQVALKEIVSVPDSLTLKDLPLQSNTLYHNVKLDLNTIIISLIVVGVVVVLLVLWLVFGKRIRKHFKAKRLRKNHTAFLEAYNKITGEIRLAFSSDKTERALVVWKKYMEQLEGRPYTKLTTRDLMALQTNKVLVDNLRNIDRAIYGHDQSVVEALQFLERAANENFNNKMQEVRHGK